MSDIAKPNFHAGKVIITAQSDLIATLRERLAEVERSRDACFDDSVALLAKLKVVTARAEAAEAANKRLRAKTIGECAKVVQRMLKFADTTSKSDIAIVEALHALASETAGGGSE